MCELALMTNGPSYQSTLVSFSTIAADDFCNTRMKLCFLWFDELVFEDIGRYNREALLSDINGFSTWEPHKKSQLLEAVTPLSERSTTDWGAYRLERMGHGYPRWGKNYENYKYPEPENPEQYAHNALLEKIEQEHGTAHFDGIDVQWAEGRAKSAIEAVMLWQIANCDFPCVFQAGLDEEDALTAFRTFGQAQAPKPAFTLMEGSVPNIDLVPWETILELKQQGTFRKLREKLEYCHNAAGGNIEMALQGVTQAENEAKEQIIEWSTPKPGVALLKAVADNIPGVGIATSIFSVANEIKRYDDLGWFYMLRELRNIGTRKQ